MNGLVLPLLMSLTPAAEPPVKPAPPEPLLYVTVRGPAGTTAAAFPGGPAAVPLAACARVGLRPGYSYRVELRGEEGALFPSLEVRGSLRSVEPGFAARHPVPVFFTADDVARARAGGLVTRVYYLENPDTALAADPPPGQTLETLAASEHLALGDARRLGRVVLIARLGGRQLTPGELAAQAVPGTVLLPGEVALAQPAGPPTLPFTAPIFFDPKYGPRPEPYECLTDGGDRATRIGLDPQLRLAGLDPSDAAIEYTTGRGVRKVCPSNRVCVCVPRFAAVLVEQLPNVTVMLQPPHGAVGSKQFQAVATRIPAREAEQIKQPLGVNGRKRPHVDVALTALRVHDAVKGPVVTGRAEGTRLVSGVKGPDDVTGYPCGFVLVKWVEPKGEHQIGDVVTFYLRYTNTTDRPVTDVAVSDSLTARFEYVPGSARADREASLTLAANEAGSVVLRWEFAAPLPPGQSGLVSFQARIR